MKGGSQTQFCGSITPLHGKAIVFGYPRPLLVSDPQVGFGWCVILFSSLLVPEHCLGLIQRHTLTVVIHLAKLVLGSGPTLLCRSAVPFRRFELVSFYAAIFLVLVCQPVLRFFIAAFSSWEKVVLRCS